MAPGHPRVASDPNHPRNARSGLASRLPSSCRMATTSPLAADEPPASARHIGYHGAVYEFKRRLIEATLHQVRGNRTHAARALGLQRTYLLRLMRDLGVAAPPPAARHRGGIGTSHAG
jgi:DNA-binding NtrC family response regulator